MNCERTILESEIQSCLKRFVHNVVTNTKSSSLTILHFIMNPHTTTGPGEIEVHVKFNVFVNLLCFYDLKAVVGDFAKKFLISRAARARV